MSSAGGLTSIPTELFLRLEDIEYRATRQAPTVERPRRTLLDKYLRVEGRRTLFETIDEMQTIFDDFFVGYNHLRPHQGRLHESRTPAQ